MYDPLGYLERYTQLVEAGMNSHAEALGKGYEAFGAAAAKELLGPTGEVLARKTDEMVQTPLDIGTAMQEISADIMQQSIGFWASANPMLNPEINPFMAMFMPPSPSATLEGPKVEG